MKTCDKCGGSGAFIETVEVKAMAKTWYMDAAKLCPCVTEKIARLERVVEAAKDLEEWVSLQQDDINSLQILSSTKKLGQALAALEG